MGGYPISFNPVDGTICGRRGAHGSVLLGQLLSAKRISGKSVSRGSGLVVVTNVTNHLL